MFKKFRYSQWIPTLVLSTRYVHTNQASTLCFYTSGFLPMDYHKRMMATTQVRFHAGSTKTVSWSVRI